MSANSKRCPHNGMEQGCSQCAQARQMENSTPWFETLCSCCQKPFNPLNLTAASTCCVCPGCGGARRHEERHSDTDCIRHLRTRVESLEKKLEGLLSNRS